MNQIPIVKGEEIGQLIPQRAPIQMIDKVFRIDELSAETGLDIKKENIFCMQGRMQESGLIEHIAQSAAAFAGYPYWKAGEKPKLGYIGEIKKFKLKRLPECGESLITTLNVMGAAAGITLISAETKIAEAEEVIAACQMKIFIDDAE